MLPLIAYESFFLGIIALSLYGVRFYVKWKSRVTNKLSLFQKLIIVLISVITIINFIDRSAISFVIQPLENEFGLSQLEFGVIAAAFGIGYVVSSFFGGILVDRFGTVGTWALSAFLWSVATMLMAAGQGYASFFALRVFLGVAEGLHFPALLRTITDWIPSYYHARATSLCLLGTPFASVIGAPLITFLIRKMGWQWMFIFLGCIGVLWAILWVVLFRKNNQALFTANLELGKFSFKKTPWKSAFFNPTFIKSCSIYFAYGYTVFFFLMWVPGYLMQVHQLSIQRLGFILIIPWSFAAGFMLIGGWLSDHLWKKTSSLRVARTSLIGLSLLFSGIALIPILFSQSFIWDLFWLSLSLGFASTLNAPIYTLTANLFGPFTGMAQGILSCSFALSGIASPVLTGWIVQSTGSFQKVFLLLSFLSISTSLMVLFFQKPDKKLL